jgi:LPXTG-site transpeptidase (sortase) family protein
LTLTLKNDIIKKMKKSFKNNNKTDYVVFILWFVVIFALSFSLLFTLGLVPSELSEDGGNSFLSNLRTKTIENVSNLDGEIKNTPREKGEEPLRVYIPKIGTDVTISNPKTTDVVVLDEYLKKGVVRYDGSGLLGDGNMLLFGHSSSLAQVVNKAYKAFNGFPKLVKGDLVYIDSENFRYVYKVETVKTVDSTTALVEFSSDKNMVTLSTCNTFGKKQERNIVEAVFSHKESKTL